MEGHESAANTGTVGRPRPAVAVRTRRLTGLVLGLVLLLLPAVGPGAVAAAGTPPTGGTVTIPIVADPTFNPWHPNAYVESVFPNRVLFNGLTKPGLDLQPVPDLAERWETSSDGLRWTFYLRRDVKWHDGQPFTAADVAYTFNEIVLKPELGSPRRADFAAVERVEVVNDYTVRFVLSRPFAALAAYLAYNAGILPRHRFEGKDPWNLTPFNKEKPVGTGPFKIESYVPGSHVSLVANDRYFLGRPYLDRLVFKILPDANTQVAQTLAGELDIMIVDNPAAVARFERSSRVKVVPVDQINYYFIAVNHDRPLFQDVRVRQAMLMAIDRQAIINSILRGYGRIATGPISPVLKAYYDPNVTEYSYDPEGAKRLLAQAGWVDRDGDGVLDKDGRPLEFVLDVGRTKDLQPISELVQQYLVAVGMRVRLEMNEWNAYIQKAIVRRDYDATVAWWITPPDPDVFNYFHSSGAGKGANVPNYRDPEVDRLLEAGRVTSNVSERVRIYRDFQKVVAERLPYLFLWYPKEIQVRSRTLGGLVELGLRDQMHYVHQWYRMR